MVVAIPSTEKRQKVLLSKGKNAAVRYSRIFSPFRTIGLVSDGKPFAIGTLGQTFYIVTVVGHSFQIFDAATLHLLFVSSTQTKSEINCVEAHFEYVYCAYGSTVAIFKRGKLQHEIQLADPKLVIIKLLVFGDYLLAITSSRIFVYEKKNTEDKFATEFYTEIPINESYGNVIDAVHLPTYLNKVVIATSTLLLLINIRSAKTIYVTENGLLDGITCLEASPALDVLAVGNDEGKIIMFNIRKARILQNISTGSKSAVTSVSFRTDGPSHLVCSLRSGVLFFYDLERRARVHVMQKAHKETYGGATKASFLNGQPIVVSTGPDNSLKEFVFDPVLSSTDSSVVSPPRYLRSRGGHSAPPCAILFADNSSHYIESASKDHTFWMFSLRKDAQSQELSQKQSKMRNGKRVAGVVSQYSGKFAPITMIAQENAREGAWDNIVTAHQHETFARTWNSRRKKVGKYELATIDHGTVSSVAMTQCGNFALVGSSNGGIGVYNIQSGKIRKLYRLHKKAVTGVAVDGMNRKMVSCGLDGIVGFYDFSESKYLGKIKLEAPITQMVYQRSSDLVAAALDDMTIVIIDASTQRIVRHLYGHTNRITAMDFTPDGRWLVSASLDATIRTWDLPTGGCIDGIKLSNVATCLKISPQGDYMATSHIRGVGTSLWTNKSQFHPVSTKSIEDESEFANMMLPNVSGEGGASVLEGAFTEGDESTQSGIYISPEQLDEDLVTLSHCSRTKFSTLLHLDTIKERNKPTEPVKKPKSAPFFLQMSADSAGKRIPLGEMRNGENNESTGDESEKAENEASSRILDLKDTTSAAFESQFTKLLREAGQSSDKDYSAFVEYLIDLSPASTDLEIKSLSFKNPFDEAIWFLEALIQGFREKRSFELLVAIYSMFLRQHGDVIYALRNEQEDHSITSNVLQKLDECDKISSSETSGLDKLTKYCSGVVDFVMAA
mgnify:FL=1